MAICLSPYQDTALQGEELSLVWPLPSSCYMQRRTCARASLNGIIEPAAAPAGQEEQQEKWEPSGLLAICLLQEKEIQFYFIGAIFNLVTSNSKWTCITTNWVWFDTCNYSLLWNILCEEQFEVSYNNFSTQHITSHDTASFCVSLTAVTTSFSRWTLHDVWAHCFPKSIYFRKIFIVLAISTSTFNITYWPYSLTWLSMTNINQNWCDLE